jgi:hypothetical protein
LIRIRKGEELKTPRYASAAATCDDRLPHSRHKLLVKRIRNNIIPLIAIRTNLNKLKAYIIVAVKLTSELNMLLIAL